jgi:hypothetical protein
MIGGFMTHSEGPYTIERDSKGRILITANDGYDGVCLINMLNKNAEGNAHLLAASDLMEKTLQRTVMEARHATSCGGNGLHGRLKTLRCDCFMKDVLRAISSAKGEGV